MQEELKIVDKYSINSFFKLFLILKFSPKQTALRDKREVFAQDLNMINLKLTVMVERSLNE
jgi:hypothetical protein